MKNRLILLALAMICYGHMQAEGWFANQWNRLRNYTPYRYGSSVYQSGDAAARTIASAGRLYEDPQLASDLEEDFNTAMLERAWDAWKSYEYYRDLVRRYQEYVHNESQRLADYDYNATHCCVKPHKRLVGDLHKFYEEQAKSLKNLEALDTASSKFKYEDIMREKNQPRPSYEYFQHPSRNILGEY